MNKTLLLIATLTALVACTTVKDSDDYRKLAAEKASLEEQIRARDEEIDEITASMNRVDSNLVAISEYVEVMDGIKLSELVKNRGEIDLMITEIGDFVKENNALVADLEKKVQESTNLNTGLKRLIDQQKREVLEKETQIAALMKQVDDLKNELRTTISAKDAEIETKEAEISLKELEIKDTRKVIEEKENTLNTGFVTYGNKKDLSDKGVIQSDGTIGFGKIVLSNKFEDSDFQAVNIREIGEIDMGVTKRQKALTQHPVDSYYFVKTDGRTFLKIVDYQKFWSISKYLVVVVDY
jgi:SMC interacting uncharacterized protein involved in chromosome segregation